MSAAGYVPNVEQSAASLRAIVFGAIWIPVVALAVSLAPVFFYGRFEAMETRIRAELEARRGRV